MTHEKSAEQNAPQIDFYATELFTVKKPVAVCCKHIVAAYDLSAGQTVNQVEYTDPEASEEGVADTVTIASAVVGIFILLEINGCHCRNQFTVFIFQ